MDRRNFVQAAVAVPWVAARGEWASSASVSAGSSPTAARGMLAGRFRLTLERVLEGGGPAYTPAFVLADARPTAERRFTEFSGDVSGRYIGALATAARIEGIAVPRLDALVDDLIALQKPDGYFGASFHYEQPNDADMALLWGNGRLLVGLLEFDQWRHSEQVLASCRRLGDFLVRIGPRMLSPAMREAFGAQHFASSYICWTQQTEGLAKLYRATKDERYRTLAEGIAAVIERRPGDHVHGYLSSLRGVMDLYGATGDPRLLAQCRSAWQEIADSSDLLITGGVPEGWSPNNHRTEGCGEADWIRLSLSLARATGEERYMEMAERAILNEFAFNQFATGDFGHRVYTPTGLAGAGAVRAWWCCTLHGLRCFPEIAEHVFSPQPDGLRYDLPLDGSVDSEILSASADSSLAEDGTAVLTITRAAGTPAVLSVRRPSWADAVEILDASRDRAITHTDRAVSLRGVFAPGDIVRVRYRMHLATRPEAPGRTSCWFGPWLLGASAADNPDYFNELTPQNRLLGQGTPVAGARKAFAVPVAATEFLGAQAEFPDQPLRVRLRAVAEQTGQPTTAWELRFLTAPTPA
jgi:DUF1680 family protein